MDPEIGIAPVAGRTTPSIPPPPWNRKRSVQASGKPQFEADTKLLPSSPDSFVDRALYQTIRWQRVCWPGSDSALEISTPGALNSSNCVQGRLGETVCAWQSTAETSRTMRSHMRDAILNSCGQYLGRCADV